MKVGEGVVYGLAQGAGIRYVGKTTKAPEQRLREHLAKARKEARRRVSKWIRSLAAPPQLVVLERAPVGGLDAAERAWIAALRDLGCDLTNTTDGGEGGATMTGRTLSPETRAKISVANRGRVISEATRAKISRTLRGRSLQHPLDCSCCVCARTPHRPDTRLKIAASSAGRRHSAESREKISAAKRGKPRSPETVAKMSRAMRERSILPEHRAQLGEIARATNSDPNVRAKKSAALKGKPWSAARRAAQDRKGRRGNDC